MNLSILPYNITITRLSPDQPIPQWTWQDKTFLSITYTCDELSIVCPTTSVPDDVSYDKSGTYYEHGWIAIKVLGPLDFSLTGILASIANPLATSKIPIFAISSFDTDYILIKQRYLTQAKEVLERAGHTFL